MKPSLLFDSWTMVVKEWHEWCGVRTRRGWGVVCALILAWSVIAPYLVGHLEAAPLIIVIAWAALPLVLSGVIITDSIAGERERQTLETLLASRLSDQSILLGKILAATLLGWSLLLLGLASGLLQQMAAVLTGTQEFRLFTLGAGMVGASVPCIVLVVSVGALFSLYAPSARFALLLIVAFAGMLLLGAIGLAFWWVSQDAGSGANAVPPFAACASILTLVDAILLGWLLLSVHRDRLLAIR